MSARALKKIESFDEDELRIFLKHNGLDGSIKYFAVDNLNGRTFLNLANPEPTGWTNLVPISDLMKIRKFIEDVKETPDKFLLTHGDESFGIQKQFSYSKDLKQKVADEDNAEEDHELEEINTQLQTMLETSSDDSLHSKLPDSLRREKRNNCTTSYTFPKTFNQCQHHAGNMEIHEYLKENMKTICAKNHTRNIDSKYYLDMNRKQAENFLRTCYLDGTYLFRPSSQHYCALSVLFENEIHHFPIESVDGRKLELVTLGDSLQFNTLEEIVKYLKLHPVLRIVELQKNINLSNPFLKSK